MRLTRAGRTHNHNTAHAATGASFGVSSWYRLGTQAPWGVRASAKRGSPQHRGAVTFMLAAQLLFTDAGTRRMRLHHLRPR